MLLSWSSYYSIISICLFHILPNLFSFCIYIHVIYFICLFHILPNLFSFCIYIHVIYFICLFHILPNVFPFCIYIHVIYFICLFHILPNLFSFCIYIYIHVIYFPPYVKQRQQWQLQYHEHIPFFIISFFTYVSRSWSYQHSLIYHNLQYNIFLFIIWGSIILPLPYLFVLFYLSWLYTGSL
jgi:hypothetical protein